MNDATPINQDQTSEEREQQLYEALLHELDAYPWHDKTLAFLVADQIEDETLQALATFVARVMKFKEID